MTRVNGGWILSGVLFLLGLLYVAYPPWMRSFVRLHYVLQLPQRVESTLARGFGLLLLGSAVLAGYAAMAKQ